MAINVAYRPRNPETTVPYQVVAEQLEMFLARQEERERPVPPFVEREFRDYLTCGVLAARGFIRVHCDSCGHDRLVPFSCRRRGLVSFLWGKTMAETAAHLVDYVFPMVPVRQWVLSIPFALRYRLAYDSSLLSDILNIFIRVVFGQLRRRARDLLGLKFSQCGAVTFVQRCGDALNLAPHFHSLVINGVYAADENGQPEFHGLPPPEDADVVRVAALVAQRVESLLKRRSLGLGGDPDTAEAPGRDEPGLAAIYSASKAGLDLDWTEALQRYPIEFLNSTGFFCYHSGCAISCLKTALASRSVNGCQNRYPTRIHGDVEAGLFLPIERDLQRLPI